MSTPFWRLREFDEFLDDEPENRSRRERFYLWRLEHPFWQCGQGGGDGVFFVPTYRARKTWWGKLFLVPLYRLGCVYADTRLWIKARTGWGMHIVKTDLEPRCYYDPDTIILYACMAMVDRYIGEGYGFIEIESEIIDMAHWWHVERPAGRKRRDAMLMELYGRDRYKVESKEADNPNLRELVFPERDAAGRARHAEFRALEAKISQDEDDMLIALMKIRRHLWI